MKYIGGSRLLRTEGKSPTQTQNSRVGVLARRASVWAAVSLSVCLVHAVDGKNNTSGFSRYRAFALGVLKEPPLLLSYIFCPLHFSPIHPHDARVLTCPDSPFQTLTLIILTFNLLTFPSLFSSQNLLEPRAFFNFWEKERKRKKKSAVSNQLFILLARNLEMLHKTLVNWNRKSRRSWTEKFTKFYWLHFWKGFRV